MTTAEAVPAIRARGLNKVFGRQRAVADVQLDVPRGSVFGFLGPNGSGKTTTIRMLLGLATPSSGEIEMLGERMPRSISSVLPRVGALVEGPAFYPFLSGRANLSRFDAADPYSVPATRRKRVASALDRVGLSHAADKKAHAYSLGMKQRLGLANALLRPRELLILDEPTNGLDPQGTREVRSLIRSLAEDGTTVFVSSHLLSEIEQVCSHVAVMNRGRLVAQGSLDELRPADSGRVVVLTPDAALARAVLTRFAAPADANDDRPETVGHDSRTTNDVGPDSMDVTAHDVTRAVTVALSPSTDLDEVVATLVAEGVRVRGFQVQTQTLEDRFIALTGEGFDVAE